VSALRYIVLVFALITSPVSFGQDSAGHTHTVKTPPEDPILGTWKLNAQKSTFKPGPGWQSQIRVYQSTPSGISVTWWGIDANGKKMHVSYTYNYDGRDYPMAGSASYDTLNAVRIDALTVKSEEKRSGKTAGTAIRTVSPDGQGLTITDEGTNRKGRAFSQILVFERQ
jgi:hypothetical protein